ncbi:MAG: beta-propeller fold lactonase family protein [Acidobacteria bacterium]|nr:beta-propeller fold lactonase family protein [Acidobacteriota bacterium]
MRRKAFWIKLGGLFLTTIGILIPTHAQQMAYVTNSGSNTVSIIDIDNNTVVGTVSVGTRPSSLSITPDGTRVYVVNTGSNNVSVIDTATNRVIATISVGPAPHFITQ